MMDGAAFTASSRCTSPSLSPADGKGGRAHKAAASAFTHWSGERCESEKAGRRLVVDLAVTLLILFHKVVAKDDEGGGFLSRP